MASSVSYDFRPALRTPVLIEGLPGVGNVGKLAADILAFGSMYGIPSACIMGETSGYIIDARSARNVMNALCILLGVEADTSELAEAADQIDAASIAAPEEAEAPAEDLSYIR